MLCRTVSDVVQRITSRNRNLTEFVPLIDVPSLDATYHKQKWKLNRVRVSYRSTIIGSKYHKQKWKLNRVRVPYRRTIIGCNVPQAEMET